VLLLSLTLAKTSCLEIGALSCACVGRIKRNIPKINAIFFIGDFFYSLLILQNYDLKEGWSVT
jgi:hypothetical protein